MGPKEKHAVKSVELATILLKEFGTEFALTKDQTQLILAAIRHHDQPEKVATLSSTIPLEVQALVDIDHQWSFTKENFWQDVYRKGINDPQKYLHSLEKDLNDYFVTEQGREKARKHLEERKKEVEEFYQS